MALPQWLVACSLHHYGSAHQCLKRFCDCRMGNLFYQPLSLKLQKRRRLTPTCMSQKLSRRRLSHSLQQNKHLFPCCRQLRKPLCLAPHLPLSNLQSPRFQLLQNLRLPFLVSCLMWMFCGQVSNKRLHTYQMLLMHIHSVISIVTGSS